MHVVVCKIHYFTCYMLNLQPWVDWFTSEVMKTPLRNFPIHKRSLLPSKIEARKVSKIVHALKMGWMKSTAEMQKERDKKQEPQFFMLWQSDDQAEEMRRIHKHIPAPKRHLPGHAESYNPPPEYLFDKKELKEWNKLKTTPWKRKLHFIPEKYNSLREVPAYPKYVKERFQRCLDLYLCPRAFKMRLTIEPESLVPQLPSPKDLQPFPTKMFIVFEGHSDMVRSISAHPQGRYVASGGDDMSLKSKSHAIISYNSKLHKLELYDYIFFEFFYIIHIQSVPKIMIK